MGTTETTVHNTTVWVDTDYTHRWVEAIGPKVTKLIEEFVNTPVDDTTGLPTAYTSTLVNGSTFALVAGAFGGNALFLADTAENDGINTQLLGEAYYLNGQYPCYFGIRFQINDVDQTDALVGLAITDTTAIAAVSDGLYFRTVDESAVLNFVAEQDSVESAIAATTLTDATWVIAEWYYDGVSLVTAYIDGVSVGTIALTDANFPDDEFLTPTMAMLTGEAVANSMTVDWCRVIQIRE